MNSIIHKIFFWGIMIFCIVIAVLCCTSCCEFTMTDEEYREHKCTDGAHLVDLTFNGETHEYVFWEYGFGENLRGSLSHWAGCKYCKNKEGVHRIDYDALGIGSSDDNNDDDDNWLYNLDN